MVVGLHRIAHAAHSGLMPAAFTRSDHIVTSRSMMAA
jgi:hypothetical protein